MNFKNTTSSRANYVDILIVRKFADRSLANLVVASVFVGACTIGGEVRGENSSVSAHGGSISQGASSLQEKTVEKWPAGSLSCYADSKTYPPPGQFDEYESRGDRLYLDHNDLLRWRRNQLTPGRLARGASKWHEFEGEARTVVFSIRQVKPGTFQLSPGQPRDKEQAPGTDITVSMFQADPILVIGGARKFEYEMRRYRFSMVIGPPGNDQFRQEFACSDYKLSTSGEKQSDRAAQAERAAETAKILGPYADLINSIRSRGGNCGTIADHLEMHLQRNDMAGFQEKLGRGAEYGCN